MSGFYVIAQGDGSFDRITTFENPDDKGLFLAVTAATSIAFFAMVGFEDSVNMVEETKEPERIFPRTLLTGLGIAVIIYMLVAVSVVTVLTSEQIADAVGGPGPARGGPDRCAGLPDRQGLPVPGGVRGRQHLADQHADGQPADLRHGPPGRAAPQRWAGCRRTRRAPYAGIIFSTLLALGLIIYVSEKAETEVVINLASVTSLLLLGVFTIVNIACLVLRRDGRESMFRSPGPTPAIAALATAFLIGPWVDRDALIYQIAGVLMLIGVGLWAITWVANRGLRAKKTGFRDIDHLE